MAKTHTAAKAQTFFLNEQHELARGEKSGGGRLPNYSGINWATKGKQISQSLKQTGTKLKSSKDPIRDERYFFLAKPVPQLTKSSIDKKKAPTGTYTEETDFAKDNTRVFSRLGLDLIEVTDDGDAVVHARPTRFEQLTTRSESLEDLGAREQSRWATVGSFDLIPPELRIDNSWIHSLQRDELSDVVIELQPLLTRVEIETVLRAIADLLATKSGEKLVGTGTDFSGRQWLRGLAGARSLRAIARDFFSVQSLHEPLYSIAAGRKRRRSTATSRSMQTRPIPEDVDHLPTVAVFDTGIPTEHPMLKTYCRGHFTAPDVTGAPGDHGGLVASRIVFGEQDFYSGLDGVDEIVGECRFLDVNVAGGFGTIHDKSVADAMQAIVGAYPDVRVFNFSFGATKSLHDCDEVERRERMLMVQDLDNFIFANDVIVAISAGNSPAGVLPEKPYLEHIDDPNWKIGHWASAFNTMVCGSSVGHLSPNGLVKHIGWPSPFTRIGPGICDCPVPGFSAPGGNRNTEHSFQAGLGVWVCNNAGLWEDRAGTSFAVPMLAREAAMTLDLLQRFCSPGAHPFGVTARAFLALTAQVSYDDDVPSRVLELCNRTLGRGQVSARRLRNPLDQSAVMVWQGVLESPSDMALVQIPIPEEWWNSASQPMLRIVIASDVPVNEAIHDLWACRRVAVRLHPGPDAKSLRSFRTRGDSHRSYTLAERVYNLKRLPKDTGIDGDMWLLKISYEEIADYHPAIDFTPQQRVAFAAELFDEAEEPISPQGVLQSLPIVNTMNRLSAAPAIVRSPVVIKSRV